MPTQKDIKKIKKEIIEALEEKTEKEMYCAICGEVCKSHTAYCVRHGRSTHKMRWIKNANTKRNR